MKEKNIFFLIEHQSKVDYSMPYRIEEYRIEIIKSAIDVEKIKNKGYEIPEVIPMVIYTGKESWNAKLHLHSIKDKRFKNVDLQRYNLIDINKYEKEKLINSDYLIDKMFLIERAKGQEETQKTIIQAVETTKDEKDKEKLIRMVKTTLMKQIDKEELEEIIKSKKGEVEVMEEVIEMLEAQAMQKGIQRGIKEGKMEGIKETIKNIINNMLQKGMKLDEIKELTGATSNEIEQVKRDMKILK